MSSSKEEGKMIKSCMSTTQWELAEEINPYRIVKESWAFFRELHTPEAKIGYIDHLLKLTVNYPSHLARMFQILTMINASLEA